MMRNKLMMIAAGAAMTIAAPAFAQDSNQDSNNGRQNREQARQNSQGPANANPRGVERSNENSVLNDGQSGNRNRERNRGGQMQDNGGKEMDDMGGDQSMRRQNSQGRANANDRARERSNQNSAVQEGMMVHDRDNRMIGRVKEVRRSSAGVVIAIVISLTVQINGSSQITLPAGSFTIVAGVVIVASITASSGS